MFNFCEIFVILMVVSQLGGTPITTSFYHSNSQSPHTTHSHSHSTVFSKDDSPHGDGTRLTFSSPSGDYHLYEDEHHIGDTEISLGKSSDDVSQDKYAEAVHAGRFGEELNRLEKRNKALHDNYIASGYSHKFKAALPDRLKTLAASHPSFGGFTGLSTNSIDHSDHFDIDTHGFDNKDFPTVFHGVDHFSIHQNSREGRIVFPPKETGKVVVTKTFPW